MTIQDDPDDWALVVDTIVKVPNPENDDDAFSVRITVRSARGLPWSPTLADDLHVVLNRAARRPTPPSSRITDDPTDSRLTRGADDPAAPPPGMADAYLVLSEAERAKGFIRPVRQSYWHDACGQRTTMGLALAETYARQPTFYGATYCAVCHLHRPVGQNGEFTWEDGTRVGT